MLTKSLVLFALGIVAANSRSIHKRQFGGAQGGGMGGMGGFGGAQGGGMGGMGGFGGAQGGGMTGGMGGFGGAQGGGMTGGMGGFGGAQGGGMGGFGGMGGGMGGGFGGGMGGGFGGGGMGGFGGMGGGLMDIGGKGYNFGNDPVYGYIGSTATKPVVPAFGADDNIVIEETDEIIKPDYAGGAVKVKEADPSYQRQPGVADVDPLTQGKKKDKEDKGSENGNKNCWATALGYDCCSNGNTQVAYTDENGDWGMENGNWCGIVKAAAKCWSESLGFPCCNDCTVYYSDESGKWGVLNDNWCGIPASC